MKTMNNVQKASLRTAAVIASFILISFTVSAQSFWREFFINNSFGAIAEALSDNSVKHNSVKTETNPTSTLQYSEYQNKESENNLKATDNIKLLLWNCYLKEVSENTSDFEDWMLNESDSGREAVNLKIETENSLELKK